MKIANLQILPAGKFKTINMCDYCKNNRDTCGANLYFGEMLNYIHPQQVRKDMFQYARKNVIACDKFRGKYESN